MSIIVVTGGRDYEGTDEDEAELRRFLDKENAVTLRHGGCLGADRFAVKVADSMKLFVEQYDPDWDKHGRAAGPIRNGIMLKGADVLIAFPGRRGTADCVRQAERAGIRVLYVRKSC